MNERTFLENEIFEFDELVKIAKSGDGVTFSDGSTLEDYHYQQLYEKVYADWEQMENTDISFKGMSVNIVEDSGFNLLLYPNLKNPNAYIRLFIPCYNQQNGYYSDKLQLIFNNNGMKYELDISGGAQDNIY